MRILGISGSLREQSHNTRLLLAAADLLPGDVEFVLLDSAVLRAVPPFDEDIEAAPGPDDTAALLALRDAIAQADAVLFSTPEYNGSIPGVLKNALDWVSRPVATNVLRGKPVAVIGASIGLFGAVWAQAELRKVLATIGARVVDRELPLPHAAEAFDERGALVAQELHIELGAHVAELADAMAVAA